MWQNAKWNLPVPPFQNRPREKSLQAYDGMSFTSLASLVDSCDVYRPASMTVRRDGLALFRQELGLSSDSKIHLIYCISTLVFPLDLLSPFPWMQLYHHPTFSLHDGLMSFEEGSLFTSCFHQNDHFPWCVVSFYQRKVDVRCVPLPEA